MILVAAALVSMLALAQPPARPPQTDQTEAVQRGMRLTVDNFAGEVVIHTWDKDAVRVQARHHGRTRVNVRRTGGGLSISASGEMGPSAVDYDITTPVLADGNKSLTATQEDLAGNVSNVSGALAVTIVPRIQTAGLTTDAWLRSTTMTTNVSTLRPR